MCKLNQKLLTIRVKPYYIFHCKTIIGSSHFITSIKDGLEIMKFLRGNTSGLAIPTYVVNAPGGLGKMPILPEYIKILEDDSIAGHTWEQKEFVIKDIKTMNLGEFL